MRNQEKIFVIGHKIRIQIPYALPLPTQILKTERHRAENIFQREPDRLMRKRSLF